MYKCVHGYDLFREGCDECYPTQSIFHRKKPTMTVKNDAPLEAEIRAKCEELANFLVEKNRSYGNSAADPLDIFSRGLTPLQKIDVRIDDKLSRMQRGNEFAGDDTYKDLTGYLILRLIVADKEGALS